MRGTLLEPIGIGTVCRKTGPPSITNMLSINISIILMISGSENKLLESECVFAYKIKCIPVRLRQGSCIYVNVYQEMLFIGMEENETLEKFCDHQVRPDTNFLNKCSIAIDKVVKLIYKHSKCSVNQVIKVHVNI